MVEQAWFTIPEAAEYLRCSERHVRQVISARNLTPRKVAGRLLVGRGELDSYVEAQPSEWSA